MSYTKFKFIGGRLNFFILKRRLHDRKLPGVTSHNKSSGVVNWIGAESPRKADIKSHEIINKTWTSRQIDNKAEYDDEYIHDQEPCTRED